MNVKLATVCARMWGAGFLGMIVSKGVLHRGPGETAFDAAALVAAIAWLTYCLLGAMALASGAGAGGKRSDEKGAVTAREARS